MSRPALTATCFIFVMLLLVLRPAHSRSDPKVRDSLRILIQDDVEVDETEPQGLVADAPSAFQGIVEEGEVAETPGVSRPEKHRDKSEAGGGVIVGGLVTALFAAVFCYIRVTRKTNANIIAPQQPN
ncbi:unnamed protein product [Rhodiola kirilowii]